MFESVVSRLLSVGCGVVVFGVIVIVRRMLSFRVKVGSSVRLI